MADEQTVEELKTRAELMGKYYFRGFGNCLAGVSATISNYVDYPEEGDECKREALSFFHIIEELYQQIPFEELKGNEDFAPILAARPLIAEYKKALDLTLQNPTKENGKKLYELNETIIKTVEDYRWNFWGLTKRIRSIPSNEKFYVKVIDLNGVEWHF